MYRASQGVIKPKKYPIALTILLFIGGGLVARADIRTNSKVDRAAVGTTQPASLGTPPTKPIETPLFRMQLPSDWKQTKNLTQPIHTLEWQATATDTNARVLDIYIDTIPTSFPLNRLYPVTGAGDHLVLGTLSDNCKVFVKTTDTLTPAQAAKLSPVPATWQGVDFVCDLPNYIRNVIGTGSSETMNTVTITGKQSGQHRYFFVYTDHTSHPDDSVFTSILQSFRAK